MILDELQGKETARHKGGREGKEELTGGESSDELTSKDQNRANRGGGRR
jgi:hypothetical protein